MTYHHGIGRRVKMCERCERWPAVDTFRGERLCRECLMGPDEPFDYVNRYTSPLVFMQMLDGAEESDAERV